MTTPVTECVIDAPAAVRPRGPDTHARSKLALLTDAFLPHAGGSRVYYKNLYQRLARDFHHSVVVLTTRTAGAEQFDARETFDGFEIVRRSTPLPDWRIKRAWRVLIPFLQTLLLCFRGKADIFHAGDLFPQGLVCLWIKRLFGKPYLVYAHGEEITQTDRFRYQPRIRNLIYQGADAVIAANDFARVQLLRIGVDEERVHTIYPGVDSVRFSPHPKDAALVQDLRLHGRTVMLSVGRLVPHKGHRILLEAIAALPAGTPRPRYLIAGEGPERRELVDRAAELGLTDDVIFLGKVNEDRLPEIYNLCDLFALANREHRGCVEGFGMVFLEAGACGKAVLAGRTGGTSGAVLDNVTGLMFDPEDSLQVTAALNLLLLNPDLRQRLGDAGRERAVKCFSWDVAARQLNGVCNQLLEAGRTRRRLETARYA